MGEVFLAFDTLLQRLVALKMVRRDRDAPEAALRLVSEARAAAALKHPNVVMLLDAGEVDGVAFLAMEYVEGETLRAHVGDAVPVATKLDWLRQLATALAAAHGIGIIHRDVKPENVIVTADGTIKVLDFGIAKRLVTTDTSAPTSDAPMSVHTAEGHVVGTSAYMAPEQRMGGAPSPTWDQFAWGMTSYEVLSGLRPTTARAAPLLSTFVKDVHFDVAVIIARAMAYEVSERHASMADVARALGAATSSIEVQPPDPHPAAQAEKRRRSPAVTGVVAVSALLFGASVMFLWSRDRTSSPAPIPTGTQSTRLTVAPTAPSAALPLVVASPPSASASESVDSSVVATPVVSHAKLGCLCMPPTPPNYSLCAKERLKPAKCRCESDSVTLCPVPWTSDPLTCANIDSFGSTMASRDGDPCAGYSSDTNTDGTLRNSHLTGSLAGCHACDEVMDYFGLEGSACVGYRNDRKPLTGIVDCDNLRFRCRRNDKAACDDLTRHNAKWPSQ